MAGGKLHGEPAIAAPHVEYRGAFRQRVHAADAADEPGKTRDVAAFQPAPPRVHRFGPVARLVGPSILGLQKVPVA